MNETEKYALYFFILLLVFGAFARQLNKVNTEGWKANYRQFESFQDFRHYVFYLWCWVVVTGVSLVVTGALLVIAFTKPTV